MNMPFLTTTFAERLIFRRSVYVVIKRFRYKKKWASNIQQKSASELAMEHFDVFYKPVYGNLWPSLRISLLSPQKYSALMNNFSNTEETFSILENLGAENIVKLSAKTKCQNVAERFSDGPKGDNTVKNCDNPNWHGSRDAEVEPESEIVKEDSESLFNPDTNLHEFMPVDKVYSERELLKHKETQQSVYEPRDIAVEILPDVGIKIPEQLRVYAFERGNVSDFPAPKPDSGGLLGYYLLDAASILPVIALELNPQESVLDLCAAPGGKSLTILQTLFSGKLTCNDSSGSRLQRLRSVLRWYLPDKSNIVISQRNGLSFREPLYDKVLVDVQCNTDRHVMTVDDNNIFKPGRIKERLEYPQRQKDLLVSGILSCKPGGSVVYSTCTLSPAQNDGVIQATLEEIWQETPINVAIQDLSAMASKFRKTFNFYSRCHYGQLVLPSLTANFGPMYFCKIRRLN